MFGLRNERPSQQDKPAAKKGAAAGLSSAAGIDFATAIIMTRPDRGDRDGERPAAASAVPPTALRYPAGIAPPDKDLTMAKEQKRGNKEARKPKDDKKNKKSKKDEPAANASSLMAANAPLGRQSKSKG